MANEVNEEQEVESQDREIGHVDRLVTPRWTSEAWQACCEVIWLGTPEFRCSQCSTVFASMLTPVRCPNGHLAKNDENKISIVHKGYEDYAFPFAHRVG